MFFVAELFKWKGPVLFWNMHELTDGQMSSSSVLLHSFPLSYPLIPSLSWSHLQLLFICCTHWLLAYI